MSPLFDRRTFLRWTMATGGMVAAAPLLAACGDDASTGTPSSASSAGASAGTKDLGALALRLAWIKNVEFAGEYLADSKGYYKDEGFSSVDLIAGGPTATPAETDVVTGKALAGLSSPDRAAAAIKQGAPVKIIATQYQKNPFAVMSMTAKPISTPQDMVGKKIGVQSTNEAVWATFLKANGIDEKSLTKVPVQFDPLPLTTGTVDGWFSYITNEPNVLELKGFDVTTFLLADHDYPLVGESYVVRTDTIEKKRDVLKAMLRAEIRGWKDSIADPAAGAALAADTYGKGLGLTTQEQTLESMSQNALIATPETAKSGIFMLSDDLVAAQITTLGVAGIDVTAEQLFDLSLLKEVYADNPTLI